MKVDVLTLFPELFSPFLDWSMVKKAQEIGALKIKVHNLRNWGIDQRGTVDDRPYGGGPGMILRIEPIYYALQAIKKQQTKKNQKGKKQRIILLSAKGKLFSQKIARKLVKTDQLILICGHYEGVDERVRKHLVDEDLSIGRYVLSGGEIPAMVVIDAVSRLLPGVLEKEGASEIESFSPGLKKMLKTTNRSSKITSSDLIEFPQYTRPPVFKGWKVPKVLLSGNHRKIVDWRTRKIKLRSYNLREH